MPNTTTLPASGPGVPADPWSASAEACTAPRVCGERLPIDTSACGAGVIYLLHFDRPYRHARHYCGWTTNLPERLARHAIGCGARLLEVVVAEGIGWQLARTWIGDRHRERAIKNQGGLSRSCPICGVTPRGPRYAVVIPDLATVDSYSDDKLPLVLVGDPARDLAGDPR